MNAALIGSFVEEVCKWDTRRESSGFITYVDLSSVDQVLKVITEPATIDGADAQVSGSSFTSGMCLSLRCGPI